MKGMAFATEPLSTQPRVTEDVREFLSGGISTRSYLDMSHRLEAETWRQLVERRHKQEAVLLFALQIVSASTYAAAGLYFFLSDSTLGTWTSASVGVACIAVAQLARRGAEGRKQKIRSRYQEEAYDLSHTHDVNATPQAFVDVYPQRQLADQRSALESRVDTHGSASTRRTRNALLLGVGSVIDLTGRHILSGLPTLTRISGLANADDEVWHRTASLVEADDPPSLDLLENVIRIAVTEPRQLGTFADLLRQEGEVVLDLNGLPRELVRVVAESLAALVIDQDAMVEPLADDEFLIFSRELPGSEAFQPLEHDDERKFRVQSMLLANLRSST